PRGELPQRALVDQGADKPWGPSTPGSAPAVSDLPPPARQDHRHGGAARADVGLKADELLLGSRQSAQNHRDGGKPDAPRVRGRYRQIDLHKWPYAGYERSPEFNCCLICK